MSNPVWPDPAALPFTLFGTQALRPGGAGDAAPFPLAQGLAGGMDLIKKFWGNLPGGAALPGFLVPTVDVEELDKRISDLRAAESWVEVNLNMLRATIQGLEVQRHTIAAIHSLSAMADGQPPGKGPGAPAPGGLPAGWPMASAVPSAAAEPSASARAEAPAASEPPSASADPPPAVETLAPPLPADPTVNLAAHNWLGYLQDQFAKVAQAALAPATPEVDRGKPQPAARPRPAGKKAATKSSKPSTKAANRRRPAAR